tara:strand:- start:664 stop:933 length:270 start_codon:yes stop_codon:yes gene_type:complete
MAEPEKILPEPIVPSSEQIAINYAAMGDSVKMINDTIAGDTVLVEAVDKQNCVDTNVAQLEFMLGQSYWTSEDMTAVNAAITAGKAYTA